MEKGVLASTERMMAMSRIFVSTSEVNDRTHTSATIYEQEHQRLWELLSSISEQTRHFESPSNQPTRARTHSPA